jgi:uncharacterized pyridoxamine 5'-phosphate oxidase family protein
LPERACDSSFFIVDARFLFVANTHKYTFRLILSGRDVIICGLQKEMEFPEVMNEIPVFQTA